LWRWLIRSFPSLDDRMSLADHRESEKTLPALGSRGLDPVNDIRLAHEVTSLPADATVTVILPSTNRITMLRTALDGIRNQTALRQIREVVVSENTAIGDGAAALCAEFSNDLPIRFIHRQPPLTSTEHGKLLLRAPYATRYVAILHDDDWWGPEHIQHALTALETTHAVACYTSFFDVTGESAPLRSDSNAMFWFGSGYQPMTQVWRLDAEAVVMSCLGGTPGRYSALVVRTEVLHAARFVSDLGNPFDNDRMFSVAFARQGEVVFCPMPTVFIRMHPGQDSRQFQQAEVNKRMTETTLWLLQEARILGVDFMAALERRLATCPPTHQRLVLEFLNLPWVRGGLQNQAGVPVALVSFWEQVDAAVYAATNPTYAQKTVFWKSKLEAALSMLEAKQNAAALRLLLEAVKSVEGCENPRVTLEALLDICLPLGRVDRPRACYLADTVAKLADAMKRPADRMRALEILKSLQNRTPSTPQPRPTANSTAGIGVR
jgi:hypothetical protein